jgi:hypothetical protein
LVAQREARLAKRKLLDRKVQESHSRQQYCCVQKSDRVGSPG